MLSRAASSIIAGQPAAFDGQPEKMAKIEIWIAFGVWLAALPAWAPEALR